MHSSKIIVQARKNQSQTTMVMETWIWTWTGETTNKEGTTTPPWPDSFFQQMPAGEKYAKGSGGIINKNVKCWKCRKWGHYADNCPNSNTDGEQNMQNDARYANDKDDPDDDEDESDGELTNEERSKI